VTRVNLTSAGVDETLLDGAQPHLGNHVAPPRLMMMKKLD
jgi:hypothetical protein